MKHTILLSSLIALASSVALASGEFAIGVNHQQFDYTEVDHNKPFMESHGDTTGLSLHYKKSFKKNMVLTLSGSQEFGATDYLSGYPEYGAKYGEIQSKDNLHREHNVGATLGIQLPQTKAFTLVPILGLNYRHFFQDTGQDNIAYKDYYIYSYNRETRYIIAPIGMSALVNLSSTTQLELEAAYDYLLYGRQDSYLSNISPAAPNLKNMQRSGFGYQLSTQVNFEAMHQHLFAKVYYQYYHIADSKIKTATSQAGVTFRGLEPDNKTAKTGLEFGIRI